MKRYLKGSMKRYQRYATFAQIVDGALWIKKGHNPEIDSYSAFFDNAKLSDTGLSRQLRQRGVTDVFVCGIATDVCVGTEMEGKHVDGGKQWRHLPMSAKYG